MRELEMDCEATASRSGPRYFPFVQQRLSRAVFDAVVCCISAPAGFPRGKQMNIKPQRQEEEISTISKI